MTQQRRGQPPSRWRHLLTERRVNQLIAATALSGLAILLLQNHGAYLRRIDYWRTGSVRIDDLVFHLNRDDEVISEIMVESGSWEGTETAVMRGLLRVGDTFVDVGANIGYYTVIGSKAVGGTGRVIAFEPDPVSFALLRRNVEANDCRNVTLVEKALSNEPGILELFIDDSNKGAHRIFDRGDERESVAVEALRLDDFLDDHTGGIDLIKVDTEGAEGLILQGMRETLRRHSEVNVLLEFAPMLLEDSGISARDVLDQIDALEFNIMEIDEHENRLVPVTAERLLKIHSAQKFSYTNLFLWRQRPRIEGLRIL